MHSRILLWVPDDCAEHGVYAEQEFSAEALDAIFVPIKRVRQFSLSFRPDDEGSAHFRFRIRSLTNPQGDPSFGS